MPEETPIQQQESEKPSQSYISRVRLKGYKSIMDTEVTFKPGLNIIIGANGSGKTNFVEFLNQILQSKFSDISRVYNFEVDFLSLNNKFTYYFDYVIGKPDSFNVTAGKVKEKLISNTEILFDRDDYNSTITSRREWINLFPANILFGIPNHIQNIQNLITFRIILESIFQDNISNRIISLESEPEITYSLKALLKNIFQKYAVEKEILNNENDYFLDLFKSHLKNSTQIKDIRVSENYSISKKNKGIIAFEYIKFEFLVNEQWLTWNQLSDGTKRMFYIITEVTFANNVILLEEPELGIHPHQLSKLMDFLKEQSEEKQIILTTHSPQVLNILDTDELDRIIVAHYDKEKGTQLHHLSEEEMGHARSYMETEGLFLSDYWVYSGFEKEEEQV